jgi:hypothetical protein
VRALDTSLEAFLADANKSITKNGCSAINGEPVVFEDNWLANMYYLKTGEDVIFIFACLNKELKQAYAISSDHEQCPAFLVDMANQLYQQVSHTQH